MESLNLTEFYLHFICHITKIINIFEYLVHMLQKRLNMKFKIKKRLVILSYLLMYIHGQWIKKDFCPLQ